MLFRQIVFVAFLAATGSGMVLGLLQVFHTSPMILAAEVYEETEDDDVWKPEEGRERIAFTFLSDILIAFGHGLLLTGAMVWILSLSRQQVRPSLSWHSGMLFGIAGYIAFFLAPAFGLPPDIPGTLTADPGVRQLWWVATVALTLGGLATFYLARSGFKLVGFLLLALPHLAGAPEASVPGFVDERMNWLPAQIQLQHDFIIATAWVNLVYWLVLGSACGHLAGKLIPQGGKDELFIQRR